MINVKKIKPMFNALITTMDKYEEDTRTSSGLIDTTKQQGTLKEYQRVISIGDTVRSVKEGDLICINPARYAVKKHQEGSLKDGVITDNPVVQYNFNIVEMDGKECLLIYDSDIRYVIEDYEEVEDPKRSDLILPDNKLIV